MKIRSATISDAKAINALINSYAERDRFTIYYFVYVHPDNRNNKVVINGW